MRRGFVLLEWVAGLGAVFIVASIGYAIKNEGAVSTNTADIASIKESIKTLHEDVLKEVRIGVSEGIKEATKEIAQQKSSVIDSTQKSSAVRQEKIIKN